MSNKIHIKVAVCACVHYVRAYREVSYMLQVNKLMLQAPCALCAKLITAGSNNDCGWNGRNTVSRPTTISTLQTLHCLIDSNLFSLLNIDFYIPYSMTTHFEWLGGVWSVCGSSSGVGDIFLYPLRPLARSTKPSVQWALRSFRGNKATGTWTWQPQYSIVVKENSVLHLLIEPFCVFMACYTVNFTL
jgi:hypothetical protein